MQKYIGSEGEAPKLNKLSGGEWQRLALALMLPAGWAAKGRAAAGLASWGGGVALAAAVLAILLALPGFSGQVEVWSRAAAWESPWRVAPWVALLALGTGHATLAGGPAEWSPSGASRRRSSIRSRVASIARRSFGSGSWSSCGSWARAMRSPRFYHGARPRARPRRTRPRGPPAPAPRRTGEGRPPRPAYTFRRRCGTSIP